MLPVPFQQSQQSQQISLGQVMQHAAAARMMRDPQEEENAKVGRSYFIADATITVGNAMLTFEERAGLHAARLQTENKLKADDPIVKRQYDTAAKVNSVLSLVLDRLPETMR